MTKRFVVLFACVSCGAAPPRSAEAPLGAPALAPLASMFEPELGKGVTLSETQTFAKCVVYPPIEASPVGFRNRLYNEYNVRSQQELDSKLEVSAAVSARGLWGAAGASGGYFRGVEMREDAFYWLVDARYVLQHESIDTSSPKFQLSALAMRLLREQGYQGFRKACGSHFYVGRTLGARYNLLYEFRSRADKFVEKIAAAARYEGFGVEAEAAMSKFIGLAKQSAMLRIHSGIEGGGASIADYASDPAALKAELARLRDDLLTRRQGDALTWEMQSYNLFPEVQAACAAAPPEDVEADDGKREALAAYYDQYRANKDAQAHLQALLQRASGSEPMALYSAATRQAMVTQLGVLQARNDTIARRASACLQREAAPCEIGDLPPIAALTPVPDVDLSGLGRWSIYPMLRPASTAIVDLYGHPGEPYAGHMFDTQEALLSSPAGAYVMALGADGLRHPTLIGSFDSVVDDSGVSRPYLCRDAYADVCTLRMIENPEVRLPDGYAASRLLLTIFDKNGLQTDKLIFRMRQ